MIFAHRTNSAANLPVVSTGPHARIRAKLGHLAVSTPFRHGPKCSGSHLKPAGLAFSAGSSSD
jgi:hypothetical protein